MSDSRECTCSELLRLQAEIVDRADSEAKLVDTVCELVDEVKALEAAIRNVLEAQDPDSPFYEQLSRAVGDIK
jgi:hypothetical protein